jgi:hypothetical protein
MAHFRGTIRGQRGQASRLGSKASGLAVVAQSWEGQIKVTLWHTTAGDKVEVVLSRHGGSDSKLLYHGFACDWQGDIKPGELA